MPDTDIKSLDPNMAVTLPGSDLAWFDIRELGVEGRGWDDVFQFYDRLPSRAKGVVPEPVWFLSQHSAGMYVRFVTDSTEISARWTLRYEAVDLDHMPATGVSGVDLYVRDERVNRWRWLGAARDPKHPIATSVLVKEMIPDKRQYMLYLPPYNGVTEVQIGIARGATIAKAPPWPCKDRRPILFYGTSIVQGACASRPGMSYAAILGRRLDRPTMNLGFSGNGKMDPPVADLLAELDPCVYVIDALPNMQEPMITERMAPMVRTLRRAHPHTPIVFVGNILYQNAHHIDKVAQRHIDSNAAMNRSLRLLADEGVTGLHVVAGASLFGDDDDATVDGGHATDLGFTRISDAIEPVLRPLVVE